MSTPTTNVTLGVYVGPDTIEAVLVRRDGDRYEPLQRFTRPRSRDGEFQTAEQMAAALPGLSRAEESDYTLQVGGDWGGGTATAAPAAPSQGDGAGTIAAASGRPFAPALKEILAECATAGYRDVPVAFCLTAPEVAYLEMMAASADDKKAFDKKKVAERVRERAPQADPDRTAVVPLAGTGPDRVLAVAVDAHDPVSATLGVLGDDAPVAAHLDAEATLIASLIGRVHQTEGERTVVVRVGTEDTLVLFFDGPGLTGVERLRSLSAYDLPETVASRVLLQQDARKAGDPDTVYVTTTGRSEPLLDQFFLTFPEAAVEPLDAAVTGLGVEVPRDEGAYRAGALLAAATAARELSDWTVTPDVHLLPTKLRRRRRSSGISWPTVAASVLLLAVVAVGVLRYLAADAEISVIEEDLRVNPPILPDENPELLQLRVDSLNRAFNTYTRALDVIDSLLVGSDEWTQSMRLVTRTTTSTGGTWLTSWQPSGSSLFLQGQALSRSQIVSLARRLEGQIEMIEYTDVGPRRVYNFDMRMPVPREMPEIARYLRSTAGDRVAADSSAIADSEVVLDPGGHDH